MGNQISTKLYNQIDTILQKITTLIDNLNKKSKLKSKSKSESKTKSKLKSKSKTESKTKSKTKSKSKETPEKRIEKGKPQIKLYNPERWVNDTEKNRKKLEKIRKIFLEKIRKNN